MASVRYAPRRPCRGGSVRFLGLGDPDHLDPASAYYVRPGQVLRLLTRQLFACPASRDVRDPRQVFAPVPDVATEIPTQANGGLSADRRVYTIRLRPGVLWDTTPPRQVTAQDFIRGLLQIAHPDAAGVRSYFTGAILGMQEHCDADGGMSAGQCPAVEGLRATDDRTLVITLRQPANDFLNILALGFASAVPAECEAGPPGSRGLRRSLVSNGPYRIARSAPGAGQLRLERNPVWRQEADPIRRQCLDSIRLCMAQEPPEVVRRWIDAGEVDLAWPFTVVSWAKSDPLLDDFPRSYPGYTLNPYLVFNLLSPNQGGAMQRLPVRQAVAYAIDKVAVCDILNRLTGVAALPLHSVIPPGSLGHRGLNLYPTPGDRGDPVKARELLTRAGYAGGLTLVAAVRDVGLHRDVMRSVASDLQKCGIELTFRTCSQSEYYGSLLTDPAKAREGAWDLAEPGWTPDWFGNNGRATLLPLFRSHCGPGTTNYGCYSNPEVDRLMEEALQEADPARAEELWHGIDLRIMTDLPVVPLLAFACQCCAARSGSGWGTGAPGLDLWREIPE